MREMSIRVKICGITNRADADAAIEAGADALGFNFYARSPRYVTFDALPELLRDLPSTVETVGLFVQQPWAEVLPAFDRCEGLRTIQVHADEMIPCERRGFRNWIPAFPVRDAASIERIRAFLGRCRDIETVPAAILVDAHVPGSFGGTGQTAPWHLLEGFDFGVPLMLAGGLNPDNVAEAIRRVRPHAVDVASGVESSPGRKDAEKMRRFVDAARSA
ncbi:MAG: phosphoribosylanthranilate isomerase [Gemmataceae bacterium]